MLRLYLCVELLFYETAGDLTTLRNETNRSSRWIKWRELKDVCISDFLTPWSSVHLQNLAVCLLRKMFPAFGGTRRFHIAFIRARRTLFVYNRNILLRLKFSSSLLYFLNSTRTFGGRNVGDSILLKLIWLRGNFIKELLFEGSISIQYRWLCYCYSRHQYCVMWSRRRRVSEHICDHWRAPASLVRVHPF
jgi:hypothetical protein